MKTVYRLSLTQEICGDSVIKHEYVVTEKNGRFYLTGNHIMAMTYITESDAIKAIKLRVAHIMGMF